MLLQNGTASFALPLRLTGNESNSNTRTPTWGRVMAWTSHFGEDVGHPVGYHGNAIVMPLDDSVVASEAFGVSSIFGQIVVGVDIIPTLSALTFNLGGIFTLTSDSSGRFDVPVLRVLGHGSSDFGTCVFEIPVLECVGTGLVGTVGIGTFQVPRLVVEGYSLERVTGTCEFRVPLLELRSYGLTGVIGQSSFQIPTLIIRGQDSGDSLGLCIFDLPRLHIGGYGDVAAIQKLYRGITMNVSHYGVTEYHNYPVNSFAYFNGVLLGANQGGIYKLDGKDDTGIPINARIRGKTEDVWEVVKRRPLEAWLTCRADGHLMLVVVLDENGMWSERFEIVNQKIYEQRLKIARGLKNRFMAFEIQNVNGSDFSIDKLRILGEKIAKHR